MKNILEQTIERKIANLRAGLGIRDLSDFVEIGRGKEGFVTTILEVCFETAHNQDYIRLRTVSFNGSGKSGRSRKSFAWPIKDPTDLSDFAEITAQVIAATKPDAQVIDPRSAFGKAFDRLICSRLINTIPDLAKSETDLQESLSCTIRENRYGRYLTLNCHRSKRSTIFFRMPFSCWESLHTFTCA